MARRRIKRLLSTRKRTKPREKTDRCEKTERWVSALIIPFAVIGLLVYYYQDSSGSLTIYPQTFSIPEPKSGVNGPASTDGKQDGINSPSSKMTVTVEGIVLNDLKPVHGSSVFATMIGADGHTYAVGSSNTEVNGRFQIQGNLKTFNSFKAKELVLYAKGGKKAEKSDGQITLSVDQKLQQRNIKIPSWALVLLPGIFLLSLWVAFVRAKQAKWKRLKHSTSVLLALLFTLSVIFTISTGINYVHTEGHKDEILSLGYAFLFQDSYVDDGPEEWIFSFTYPQKMHDSNSSAKELQGRGTRENQVFERAKKQMSISTFGAPLWVILLSVIGASITTVSLIVRETKVTLDYENAEDTFWQRIQDIVQHQFLILFAPLGAIFVYQSLVAADAVNNPLTVALAALGAGPTVNYLLRRSIKLSKNALESSSSAGEEKSKHSDKTPFQNKIAAT